MAIEIEYVQGFRLFQEIRLLEADIEPVVSNRDPTVPQPLSSVTVDACRCGSSVCFSYKRRPIPSRSYVGSTANKFRCAVVSENCMIAKPATFPLLAPSAIMKDKRI